MQQVDTMFDSFDFNTLSFEHIKDLLDKLIRVLKVHEFLSNLVIVNAHD